MPDSRTFTFRRHNARVPESRDPRRIDAAVADDWCWRAEAGGEEHAVEAEAEQRSPQGAAEYYKVSVDLVAAAALACSV